MGTNNVDHCTRLCHSPSVEAMLVSMGSGATSNSYQDYEEAGCLMVVGADASANHPVIAHPLPPRGEPRARAHRDQPEARSSSATRPTSGSGQRPGTDVALFNAMARGHPRRRARRPSTSSAPHRGFERLGAPRSRRYTLEHAERSTGVPAERHRAGRALVRAAAVLGLLPHLGHGHHPAHQRHRTTRTRS